MLFGTRSSSKGFFEPFSTSQTVRSSSFSSCARAISSVLFVVQPPLSSHDRFRWLMLRPWQPYDACLARFRWCAPGTSRSKSSRRPAWTAASPPSYCGNSSSTPSAGRFPGSGRDWDPTGTFGHSAAGAGRAVVLRSVPMRQWYRTKDEKRVRRLL